MEIIGTYLLNVFMGGILPIAGTLIAGLAAKALHQITKDLGITIDEKEQKALVDNITKKVMQIEEINAWNIKAGNKPLNSVQKMDFVAEKIFKEIGGKISKAQISDIAHAVIAGIPKFGATK
jgi:hypothetical protein